MEMYVHYKSLPEGKDIHDVVGELNEVLEEDDELEPLQPEAAAMIASADNKTAIFFFIISFSFPLDI